MDTAAVDSKRQTSHPQRTEASSTSTVSRVIFRIVIPATFGGLLGAAVGWALIQNKADVVHFCNRITDGSRTDVEDENIYGASIGITTIVSLFWSWWTAPSAAPKQITASEKDTVSQVVTIEIVSKGNTAFGQRIRADDVLANEFLYPGQVHKCAPVEGNFEQVKSELEADVVIHLELSGEGAIAFTEQITGILNSLDTLAFRNVEVSADFISALSTSYPSIAAFDLRECTVSGDLTELESRCIVVRSESNNIMAHYNGLREKLKTVIKSTSEEIESFLVEGNPLLADGETFYPAARYFNTISSFANTGLTNEKAKTLGTHLSTYFPRLHTLILSGNTALTLQVLTNLAPLKLVQITLNKCPRVIYDRSNALSQERINAIVRTLEALGHNGLRKVSLDYILRNGGGIEEQAFERAMRSLETRLNAAGIYAFGKNFGCSLKRLKES